MFPSHPSSTSHSCSADCLDKKRSAVSASRYAHDEVQQGGLRVESPHWPTFPPVSAQDGASTVGPLGECDDEDRVKQELSYVSPPEQRYTPFDSIVVLQPNGFLPQMQLGQESAERPGGGPVPLSNVFEHQRKVSPGKGASLSSDNWECPPSARPLQRGASFPTLLSDSTNPPSDTSPITGKRGAIFGRADSHLAPVPSYPPPSHAPTKMRTAVTLPVIRRRSMEVNPTHSLLPSLPTPARAKAHPGASIDSHRVITPRSWLGVCADSVDGDHNYTNPAPRSRSVFSGSRVRPEIDVRSDKPHSKQPRKQLSVLTSYSEDGCGGNEVNEDYYICEGQPFFSEQAETVIWPKDERRERDGGSPGPSDPRPYSPSHIKCDVPVQMGEEGNHPRHPSPSMFFRHHSCDSFSLCEQLAATVAGSSSPVVSVVGSSPRSPTACTAPHWPSLPQPLSHPRRPSCSGGNGGDHRVDLLNRDLQASLWAPTLGQKSPPASTSPIQSGDRCNTPWRQSDIHDTAYDSNNSSPAAPDVESSLLGIGSSSASSMGAVVHYSNTAVMVRRGMQVPVNLPEPIGINVGEANETENESIRSCAFACTGSSVTGSSRISSSFGTGGSTMPSCIALGTRQAYTGEREMMMGRQEQQTGCAVSLGQGAAAARSAVATPSLESTSTHSTPVAFHASVNLSPAAFSLPPFAETVDGQKGFTRPPTAAPPHWCCPTFLPTSSHEEAAVNHYVSPMTKDNTTCSANAVAKGTRCSEGLYEAAPRHHYYYRIASEGHRVKRRRRYMRRHHRRPSGSAEGTDNTLSRAQRQLLGNPQEGRAAEEVEWIRRHASRRQNRHNAEVQNDATAPSQDPSRSQGSLLYYEDVDSDALVDIEHRVRRWLGISDAPPSDLQPSHIGEHSQTIDDFNMAILMVGGGLDTDVDFPLNPDMPPMSGRQNKMSIPIHPGDAADVAEGSDFPSDGRAADRARDKRLLAGEEMTRLAAPSLGVTVQNGAIPPWEMEDDVKELSALFRVFDVPEDERHGGEFVLTDYYAPCPAYCRTPDSVLPTDGASFGSEMHDYSWSGSCLSQCSFTNCDSQQGVGPRASPLQYEGRWVHSETATASQRSNGAVQYHLSLPVYHLVQPHEQFSSCEPQDHRNGQPIVVDTPLLAPHLSAGQSTACSRKRRKSPGPLTGDGGRSKFNQVQRRRKCHQLRKHTGPAFPSSGVVCVNIRGALRYIDLQHATSSERVLTSALFYSAAAS